MVLILTRGFKLLRLPQGMSTFRLLLGTCHSTHHCGPFGRSQASPAPVPPADSQETCRWSACSSGNEASACITRIGNPRPKLTSQFLSGTRSIPCKPPIFCRDGRNKHQGRNSQKNLTGTASLHSPKLVNVGQAMNSPPVPHFTANVCNPEAIVSTSATFLGWLMMRPSAQRRQWASWSNAD